MTWADKVIDIAKFQNFWITLFLVGAHALLVIAAISKAKTVGDFALPGFSATFLTLLGISHAGYIAGKLPNQSGIPDGLGHGGAGSGRIPQGFATDAEDSKATQPSALRSLALGTRHVIASVVPIPDAETAPLMIALHRLLAAGEQVTLALSQAQRQLGSAGPAAMAAAAGFVSIGTGSARPA